MNVALWIAQVLLAVAFGLAGFTKLSRSRLALAGQMGWVENVTDFQLKAIGGLEVLAVIGLVVAPFVPFAGYLAPLAAVGLVLLMAGAAVTHLRRGELPQVAGNAVLLAVALFVAVGRFGPYHF